MEQLPSVQTYSNATIKHKENLFASLTNSHNKYSDAHTILYFSVIFFRCCMHQLSLCIAPMQTRFFLPRPLCMLAICLTSLIMILSETMIKCCFELENFKLGICTVSMLRTQLFTSCMSTWSVHMQCSYCVANHLKQDIEYAIVAITEQEYS